MTSPAIAPQLKKTALNATHRALKAKMVDFGGWDMPVEYPGPGGGLIAEHMAVRTGVGLFDVSHMGEIQFRGPGALAAVQHITMNDASRLQGWAGALLRAAHAGGHVCGRHSGAPAERERLSAGGERGDQGQGLCVDSASRWARCRRSTSATTPSYYSQLAVQGPRALETLQKLTKVDLAAIKNYWFTWGTVAGVPNVMIARTGYSGEDGFEVYIPADEATTVKMWNALMEAGAEFGIRPCGLGARNTLRLEAGMSLYGHEISEEINVFEARARPLAQAGQGRVYWARGVAGGAGCGRAEARRLWAWRWWSAGSGAMGTPCCRSGWRRDRRGYIRLAGAVFEDQYCDGAGACGGGCQRRRCAGAGAGRIRCGRSRCRLPFYKRAKK